MHPRLFAAALAAALVTANAYGHGSGHAAKQSAARNESAEERLFGRPGDAKTATRTIRIDMRDEMEFLPNGLKLKVGDTVRFEVANGGKVMHELVLGTMEDLKEHAALMRKFPNMEHDEPYMAHVAPGKTETIVWQFTRAGEFYYACLIPGHFEAGMIGKVEVTQ
jgi:uncharacterized cupredoxin-like copper-binding protein